MVVFERRETPRKPVLVHVEDRIEIGVFSSIADNMSTQGLFLNTEHILPQGTVIDLAVTLDHNTIQIKGEVRWSRQSESDEKAGMGVLITQISDDDQKVLDSFLSNS